MKLLRIRLLSNKGGVDSFFDFLAAVAQIASLSDDFSVLALISKATLIGLHCNSTVKQ